MAKIKISLQKLHTLAEHSRKVGTELEWMVVALEWADGVSEQIKELTTELELTKEIGNGVSSALMQQEAECKELKLRLATIKKWTDWLKYNEMPDEVEAALLGKRSDEYRSIRG